MRVDLWMISLLRTLRGFLRSERGGTTVEFVLVIPLLAWCFVGTYTFFAAYRLQVVNVKAAYTIGDQISRETNFITPSYIAAMGELHDFLVMGNPTAQLRITAFEYELSDNSYRVIWSRGIGQPNRVTDARMNDVQNRLPVMVDEEIAVLTETWVSFDPADMVGMDLITFYEPIVTRPRFATQVCWNSVENGTFATGVCQAGH